MATYTLLEYSGLDHHANPIEPPAGRTTGLAFGIAQSLDPTTVYFKAIPDVDARMRVSRDGAAATAADRRIYADVGSGGITGIVTRGGPVSIYLIAA